MLPGSAVIADGNEKEREALGKILEKQGFNVTELTNGGGLLDLCKQLVPDVVLLDVDLDRLDVRQTVRILSRHPDTKASVVIIVCPTGTDQFQIRKLRALDVFEVMTRPLTVEKVVRTFDRAKRWSAELKQMFGIADRNPVRQTKHVEGCNALLSRPVYCPFHDEAFPLERYILRSGKIFTDTSFLDLPVYRAGMKGVDYVNYNLLGVMVCPSCLFASNNPGYFIDPSEKKTDESESDFNAATIAAIRASTPERKKIAGQLGKDFFTYERTEANAIIAHRLAIESATKLLEANPVRMSMELLRKANYHLRLADFAERTGQERSAVEAEVRLARGQLKEGFGVLGGAALYKVAYQLIACSIYFNEDAEAHPYLNRLVELGRKPQHEVDAPNMLERYLARAKKIWEDRDEYRGCSLSTIAGEVGGAASGEPEQASREAA